MIDKMIALNSSAIADEMKKVQIRKTLDDGSSEEIEVPLGDEEEEQRPRFSTTMVVYPGGKKED
ncbi:hypothetical protein D3C84_803560 [compost metagenome]